MSVPLKVGKKKVPKAVGEESIRIMCDNTEACKVVGSDKTNACTVVESDKGLVSDHGQEKVKGNNNMATVGDDYHNKVDEYFAKLQV